MKHNARLTQGRRPVSARVQQLINRLTLQPDYCKIDERDVVLRKAIVIYASKYGNTEKIAFALSQGLKDGGLDTECIKAKNFDVASLERYDFVAIGSPTQGFGAHEPETQDFLKKLEKTNFHGKKAFAFDTKFEHRIYNSAAQKIEEKLKAHGFEIVKTATSAFVERWYGPLKEGSEEKFRQIGSEIAEQIVHD